MEKVNNYKNLTFILIILSLLMGCGLDNKGYIDDNSVESVIIGSELKGVAEDKDKVNISTTGKINPKPLLDFKN